MHNDCTTVRHTHRVPPPRMAFRKTMARVSLARDNVHTWPTGSTGSGGVPWAVRRLEWAWGSWRGPAAREERISQHDARSPRGRLPRGRAQASPPPTPQCCRLACHRREAHWRRRHAPTERRNGERRLHAVVPARGRRTTPTTPRRHAARARRLRLRGARCGARGGGGGGGGCGGGGGGGAPLLRLAVGGEGEGRGADGAEAAAGRAARGREDARAAHGRGADGAPGRRRAAAGER